MDFNIDKDFEIFDALLKKRPEIKPDSLKKDLKKYYLPYIKKLLQLKDKKNSTYGLIVGTSAIQGVGKTTQGEILEVLLSHLGYFSISLSIDDHYLTHKELCNLRNDDPRFIKRGMTHDLVIAVEELKALKKMRTSEVMLIAGYDKGVQNGDGDRMAWVNLEDGVVVKAEVVEEEIVLNTKNTKIRVLKITSIKYKDKNLKIPKNMGTDIPLTIHYLPRGLCKFFQKKGNKEVVIKKEGNMISFKAKTKVGVPVKYLPKGWRIISKKPDFIFYDGWMLGARAVSDEAIFNSGLPALESEGAREFAKFVNQKLKEYENLWDLIDFLNVLYVPDYQISLKWRDQAEDALRAKGAGMTQEEIKEFVYYFWRSVHPGIHIKNLAYDEVHTDQVVIINDDHTINEVLSPSEIKLKYP